MSGKSEELIRFCQILSTALKSGRSLPDSLLAMQANDAKSSAWCREVGKKLAQGGSIETAVKDLEGFDPVLARLMPLLGENRMILVLESYTKYLVIIESLSQRLAATMAYPVLLLSLLGLNLLHMNFYLFPRALHEMQAGGRMPSLTMKLLYFADVNFWPMSLIVPVLLVLCLTLMIKQFFLGFSSGGTIIGMLSGMNSIVSQQNAARALSVTGLYLEAGYPLEKALKCAAELMGPVDLGLRDAVIALEHGNSVQAAFSRSKLLRGIYLDDLSGDGLMDVLRRNSRARYISSMRQAKNASVLFGILTSMVAAVFVLSVTSGFFDTYYWLMWSY
jgi:type II secretory pathway component PulF